MTNPFKLTTGFLVISVVIFVIAALVITRSATRNEEANVVNVISAQSGKDAQVIAGIVTGLMTGSEDTGVAAPADSPHAAESMAIATFLRTSGIVRISLFSVDGGLVWSSDGGADVMSPADDAFSGALSGEMSSSLDRSAVFTGFDGREARGDIVTTFVPLLDAGTEQPSQVLEVSRDVTDDLHTRIDSAKTSMFQTVFGTLGAAFITLFGVVLSADVLIWRSRKRALSNERALAEETIIATRLEMENHQLRQMNEERDRFLSMISHELRTPLTSILGFTDVLARRQGGESKERNIKHLEVMRRNGEHLNSLIGELLEISRIQAGNFEVVKEDFKVDELVTEASQMASPLLDTRRQTLKVQMRAAGVELYGDRKRLIQVLINLLSNASKYSPIGSEVILTVERHGDSLRISVGDEGNGIPEDDQKHLFQRFFRCDDEVTRSQSGLGLGLSIVKAIVDAHNGEIDVDSKVGLGTVMTITLPGARSAVLVPASVSALQHENARRQGAARTARDRGHLKPVEAA